MSDEVSDQEINLAEDEKEPDQDHDSLDETWQCKDGTGRGWRCGRGSIGVGIFHADISLWTMLSLDTSGEAKKGGEGGLSRWETFD